LYTFFIYIYITISGSTKNLSNQGSLKNYVLKEFFKEPIKVPFKEPFKNHHVSVCSVTLQITTLWKLLGPHCVLHLEDYVTTGGTTGRTRTLCTNPEQQETEQLSEHQENHSAKNKVRKTRVAIRNP